MKRFMAAAAVLVGLVGLVGMAGAVTVINNYCTGTYQLTGKTVASSGIDSAVVRALNPPVITITKIATNVRTGASDGYSVAAVQGDSVEFKMIWANTGEAAADTIVLSDYVPVDMTYVGGSVSDTKVNATAGAATEDAGLVQYVATAVGGTDTAAGDGIVKFQATVN